MDGRTQGYSNRLKRKIPRDLDFYKISEEISQVRDVIPKQNLEKCHHPTVYLDAFEPYFKYLNTFKDARG